MFHKGDNVKIRNSVFSMGRNFCSIDRNGKKSILESLLDLIAIRLLFDSIDRKELSTDRN